MDITRAVRRVLVVDDDLAIRHLFETLFARDGYKIDTACDGDRAWDMILTNEYEVVILDLMMPRVSGFELVDRIEAQRPQLLQRVIVATGASTRTLKDFDGSRVHSIIRKPFDIDELMATARGICS